MKRVTFNVETKDLFFCGALFTLFPPPFHCMVDYIVPDLNERKLVITVRGQFFWNSYIVRATHKTHEFTNKAPALQLGCPISRYEYMRIWNYENESDGVTSIDNSSFLLILSSRVELAWHFLAETDNCVISNCKPSVHLDRTGNIWKLHARSGL